MKKRLMVAAVVIMMVTGACNEGMGSGGGHTTKGQNDRLDKSRRTSIDGGKYIDFTVSENDARKFRKEDLLHELNGTYQIENGNSFIKINRMEGSITLSSDDAFYNGKSGNNMYVKYTFDVEAANSDCLYIRMKDKRKAQLIMNNEMLMNEAIPDLTVCLPLYGIGRNRVEVSSIMNGFIAMPSGTYWYKK